jgi:hypothetical protein
MDKVQKYNSFNTKLLVFAIGCSKFMQAKFQVTVFCVVYHENLQVSHKFF